MPYFLNGHFRNNEFQLMAKDKYFVDKTMLIDKINELIGIKDRFVCITRPRRFGKTINAMMLASYYSKNADFKYLFDDLNISKSSSYLEHLNKHNVIYLTFNQAFEKNCTYEEFIGRYINFLKADLKGMYNAIVINEGMFMSDIFKQVYDQTGEGFVFIIDEWDYIFNNNLFSEDDRKSFLRFLEDLLKDKPYVELAYMTGVLPIAKYSSGSALNMFLEFNMMEDNMYDECFGFTNEEVKTLCQMQNKISMKELTEWYNGYKTESGLQIYNPRSVVNALKQGVCRSYWTNTGPMDEIIYYINNDIESVKSDMVQMIAEIPLNIKLKGYSAEQKELNTRNQILSAMTVYGFLSYYDETLMIPNKELRIKFDEALEDKAAHTRGARHKYTDYKVQ